MLEVGAMQLPALGQLDLAPGFSILASGLDPGSGLGTFFFTSFLGVMDFSSSVPTGLIGQSLTFQAAVLHPTFGAVLTNAVETNFLP